MSDDVVEQVRDAFGRASAGWERWADLIAQRDDAARYVDAARVEPGHRVLEIGAGTGDQTPVRSASRVRDLLTPGARFAVSVWGPTDQVPMISIAMGAALQELDIDPPAHDERTAPDLSESGVFRNVLVDAGFIDVSVHRFTFTLTWESPEQYADWIRDVFVDLSDVITEHAPDRSDDVYAAVARAARDHVAADESLTFENIALMGVGQRPVGR